MLKKQKLAGNFTQIPNEIIRNPDLSLQAKAVYNVIASFNPSYPSYKDIMESTGIGSKSTISKAIKELTSFGLISLKSGSKFKGKNNTYTLNAPAHWTLTSTPSVPKVVHLVDSNNTNNNIYTAEAESTGKVINPEHQELLNACLKTTPNNSFLKDKQEKLNKYGNFTEKIVNTLKIIKNNPANPSPSSAAPLPLLPRGKVEELLKKHPAHDFTTELNKFQLPKESTPESLFNHILKIQKTLTENRYSRDELLGIGKAIGCSKAATLVSTHFLSQEQEQSKKERNIFKDKLRSSNDKTSVILEYKGKIKDLDIIIKDVISDTQEAVELIALL